MNSRLRWRSWHVPITVPLRILNAANRVVVPWVAGNYMEWSLPAFRRRRDVVRNSMQKTPGKRIDRCRTHAPRNRGSSSSEAGLNACD
jgi:hypothetical protein